ncbi:MAG: response regulator, partial [Pseudanabaena sp.]
MSTIDNNEDAISPPLILLAEDNEANIITISAYLQAKGYRLIIAKDGQEAVDLILSASPDVVLMDIHMPGADGIEGLKQIRHSFPHIKVLMQTVFDDADMIFESIRNGASGYILKMDPPLRILQAIQEVYDGGAVMNPAIASKVLEFFQPKKIEHPLSDRESEVLQLLADGLSYKMVADKMNISIHTVNT